MSGPRKNANQQQKVITQWVSPSPPAASGMMPNMMQNMMITAGMMMPGMGMMMPGGMMQAGMMPGAMMGGAGGMMGGGMMGGGMMTVTEGPAAKKPKRLAVANEPAPQEDGPDEDEDDDMSTEEDSEEEEEELSKSFRDVGGPKGLPRRLKIRCQERVTKGAVGPAFYINQEELLRTLFTPGLSTARIML